MVQRNRFTRLPYSATQEQIWTIKCSMAWYKTDRPCAKTDEVAVSLNIQTAYCEDRRFFGETPSNRRMWYARWLWLAKPVAIAISLIDRDPSINRVFARSTRRWMTYWWIGIPVAFRKTVLQCETLRPTVLEIFWSDRSSERLSSMYARIVFKR